MYCKYDLEDINNEILENLIETFCIVNLAALLNSFARSKFNRNILYCKFWKNLHSRVLGTNLIETFCIVNFGIIMSVAWISVI